MIDANLPHAVTYQRRDYEAEAMMRELCFRNGMVLPLSAVGASEAARASTDPELLQLVYVVAHDATAGALLADLLPELKCDPRLRLTMDPADLSHADRVLLVLTPGVVHEQQPLSLVTEAGRIDSTRH